MSTIKDRSSSTGGSPEDAKVLQQNALQSDFTTDDTRSVDSDERYLVWLIEG